MTNLSHTTVTTKMAVIPSFIVEKVETPTGLDEPSIESNDNSYIGR